MHPITRTNFGVHGIKARFNNGSAELDGYIIKQSGTNQFVVTDGTTMVPGSTTVLKHYVVSLAPTLTLASALTPGHCTIALTAGAAGATFVSNYGVATAVIHAGGGGSGYVVGDHLPLTGAGGAILAVATLGAGSAIATVTVLNAGTATSLGGIISVAHGTGTGAGTGATFDLAYKLLSVVPSGGSKYAVGESLTFTGGTGTAPTAHISSVGAGGAPTGVVVDTPGVVTVAPTVGVMATEYVSRIWDSQLRTVEGNMYKWSLGTSKNGTVALVRFSEPLSMAPSQKKVDDKEAAKPDDAKAKSEAKSDTDTKAKSEAKSDADVKAKSDADVKAKEPPAQLEATKTDRPDTLHIKGEVEGDIKLVK